MPSATFLRKWSLTTSCLMGAQLLLPPLTTLDAQTALEQVQPQNRVRHPNILFVIMDDVGD
jgi:hypothetical protein